MHIIRTLVSRGRFFAKLYLCDKDSTARKVALATLQQLVHGNPDSFAPSLRGLIVEVTLFEQIPQDVTLLDAASIITLVGVNLVIASPDCQPFSTAGNQLGFQDLRSSSFSHCLRAIRSIHDLTLQPLTYVV